MKNTKFISIPGLPLQVFLLAVLTLFLFSCSTEEVSDKAELSASGFEASVVAASKKAAPAPGESSIAVIAGENGFSELLKALTYVDEELQTQFVTLFTEGTDQYTVFAPTNDAFAALYEKLGVSGIEQVSVETVRDVLLYHVVEGRRAANSVVPPKNDKNIETLLGKDFQVDPDANIYAVGNNASITTANISASNGIIHIIDAVLLPFTLE